MDAALSVQSLQKTLNNQALYHDLTFNIETGKITAVLGPNGCGKSSLLNILSGIMPADSGKYDIKNFHAHAFSYVFQDYRESLLPWRTNFENLAFPLEIQKWNREKIKRRINELQNFFELKFSLAAHPYELSGGQQQILAFARALAPRPKLLFLDEPFSALDYENSIRLREKLQEYHQQEQPTVFLISHNIEEAVQVAHRIMVLSGKPMSILVTIENPLPFPRTLETLKSKGFDDMKDRIVSEFQKVVPL